MWCLFCHCFSLSLLFGYFARIFITKTRLFKYIEKCATKMENFQIKKSDIFHVPAQNIGCGYPLEQPRREKIMYTTVNPSFTL